MKIKQFISLLLFIAYLLLYMPLTSAQELREYMAESQAALDHLSQTMNTTVRNRSIIKINTSTSLSELTQATDVLKLWIEQKPDDIYAKMYYGYGLLFLSSIYQQDKNYMRAAELSKQGFFFIDEAAESKPDEWKLRYLRARMDSFVPAEEGRCIIAINDLKQLKSSQQVPNELNGIIAYLYSNALTLCQQLDEAKKISDQLPELSGHGNLLIKLKHVVPFLTQEEITNILQPVLEGGK